MLHNEELEQKVAELTEKINKIYVQNEIGEDIRKELDIEQYKKLRDSGVSIDHLEKKFKEELYPQRKAKNKHRHITETEIKEALKTQTSAIKAAKFLGVSYPTYKKYAKKYGIHATPGWPIQKGEKRRKGPSSPHKGKFPIDDILAGKFPDFPTHRLKDKLIRSEYKHAECEVCGFKERRITDGKLPLLLNFDDGDKTNHNIENLKILCYNCTFTCGKGYINRGPKFFDPDILQDSKRILNTRF